MRECNVCKEFESSQPFRCLLMHAEFPGGLFDFRNRCHGNQPIDRLETTVLSGTVPTGFRPSRRVGLKRTLAFKLATRGTSDELCWRITDMRPWICLPVLPYCINGGDAIHFATFRPFAP
jgi:hypothetical protein